MWFARALASRTLILLGVLLAVYAVADLLPGDPVRLAMGPSASPDDVEARREALGLDRPLLVRFGGWLAGLVTGNLGTTIRGQSVQDLLGDRLGATALLSGGAFLVVLVVCIVWALMWAIRPGGRLERASEVTSSVLVATPEFVLGTALIVLFALVLGMLPATTIMDADGDLASASMLVLPVLALALPHAGWQVRVTRAALKEAASLPHVEQARLDGYTERQVFVRHVLPLAAPTVAASMATLVGTLLGGAVVVETLFNYPGAGGLVAGSLRSRDTTLLVSLAALIGVVVMVALVVADLIRFRALRGRR